MKINFTRSLKRNKPAYIQSEFYPAAGYVAMPENNPSDFKRRKHFRKIKSLQHELGSIAEMIKQFIYNIVSVRRNRERN